MSSATNQPLEEASTCAWCSASVPAEAATCPSCGAALRDGVSDEIAGVTQVDLAATTRLARQKPPGRIAVWLGAERVPEDAEAGGAIEPPSDEVRKEMLRLELAAIDAEIEAKAQLAEAQRSLPPEDADLDVAPPAETPLETAPPAAEPETGEARKDMPD